MLTQACPRSKTESSKGITVILISILPSKRIELMRIIKVLLTIMIGKQLYLQASSL